MKLPKLVGRPQDASPGQYQHPRDSRITLIVLASGKRSWRIRPRVAGRQAFVSFDGTLTPDAVAALALPCFAQAAAGIDPNEARAIAQVEQKAAHDVKMKAYATFADVRAAYLADPTHSSWRPATRGNIHWVLTASPYAKKLASRALQSITTEDIKRIKAACGNAGTSKWHTVGGRLRTLFSWAVKNNYLARSPFDAVPVEAAPSRVRPMIGLRGDMSELAATLNAIDTFEAEQPGSPFPTMWRVLTYTGLRPGAIENLRIADVDLHPDHPTITVTEQASKIHTRLTVPVSAACAEQLRRAIARKPDCFTRAERESDLIWAGRKGGTLSKPNGLFRRVNAIRGNNDGKWKVWVPHRGRDSMITWLLSTKVHMVDIAWTVNWTAPGMVGNYANEESSIEDRRPIVEAYAAAIGRARNPQANVVNIVRAA